MSQPEGNRIPKMRGGRERLTVHRPQTEHALASITFDGFNIDETRRFGNRLLAQVEAFQRDRPAQHQPNRLSKVEAARAYAQAFGFPRKPAVNHQQKARDLLRSGVPWPTAERFDLQCMIAARTLRPDQQEALHRYDAIHRVWKAQQSGVRP